MKKYALLAGFGGLAIIGGIVYAGQQGAPNPYSEQDYRQFISVEDLYAGRGNVGESTGLPIVWFKVRNTGEYTVEHVQVTVEFLDKNDRVVFEKKLHPVHQGREAGEPVKPLGPGDLWQMSAVRYYIVTKVPHTWKLGNVRAKVTALEFET